MTIPSGAEASIRFAVGDDDTATALGSGDVPVLATPRLLAWCEAATVAALAAHLDAGSTSVGHRIELDHVRPTPVGGEVDVRAEVTGVDGRQVTLAVTAADGGGDVAAGTVTRVVVDRQRFVDRLG
ncbi:MAG: hotdog domain-containing protein [Actinomycetota bacterium]